MVSDSTHGALVASVTERLTVTVVVVPAGGATSRFVSAGRAAAGRGGVDGGRNVFSSLAIELAKVASTTSRRTQRMRRRHFEMATSAPDVVGAARRRAMRPRVATPAVGERERRKRTTRCVHIGVITRKRPLPTVTPVRQGFPGEGNV